MTILYSMGLNSEATVPYMHGRVPPVDATDTAPEKAYAVPSQTPRPVPMPKKAEVTTAILLCLRQMMVKMTGMTPGHVRTPGEGQ